MLDLPKYSYFVVGFVVLVLVGNLVLLDVFYVSQRSDLLDFQTRLTQLSDSFQKLGNSTVITPTPVVNSPTVSPTLANPPAPVVTDTSCPQSCVTLINASKANTQVVSQPTAVSQKGEYFINLGTGSVLNTEADGSNWKTIDSAQAAFDVANYGNVKSATLEVFAHIQSAGEVHIRLLDATTPAIFWGVNLTTTSVNSVYLTSSPISFGPGAKTYKIQMYSTLSTGYLDQARIHIVTQ